MSFLGNMIDNFTHKNQNQNINNQPQQQSYGNDYGSGYNNNNNNNTNNNGAPQVPPPWVAEWDHQAQRWCFVNRETGYRTYDHPGRQGGYSGGGSSYNTGYGNEYEQRDAAQPVKKDHSGRNMALGAAAGVAGGALLMHEGHKIEEHWDEDKYRMENRFDQAEDRVEDFPDNAARWTGRKVQEVEDIPDDVAGWTGRKVQEVEDIPEDVAGWTGRRVGDADRFGDDVKDRYDDARDDVDQYGDRLGNAYDGGRDDARYDDDDDDGRY